MKTVLSLLTIAALTSAAAAQTVYEPVRYQYGRYNEVFYGGRNPTFTNNSYVYLPPALQTPYAVNRLSTPPFINAYTPLGAGSPFVSPYNPSPNNNNPNVAPLIFTDYLPYEEASQFGFTVDDARNEAYNNVPRLQSMSQQRAQSPATAQPTQQPTQPVATTPPAPPTDPKLKAIPLLSWAKAERTKNPTLYKALINEARKYDPAATTALETTTASEK